MEITDAVKELRASIGLTQEKFSRELDCTLNAVARYETGRKPEARQLFSLFRLAQQHKHPSSAVFSRELRRALGADPDKRLVI
jgi:transcriptional regulator with XRE-family HTH domain